MTNKVTVVFASILKPLDDSRILFKLGFSLRETNKYDLNIIGFSSKNTPIFENIKFIEIFNKSRSNPLRLWAPIKFFFHLLRIKPKLVIVTSFELLPVVVLAKKILGFRLIYDVQENHVLNLEHNKTQPFFFRKLAMSFVSFCEGLSAKAIDHYLFAEKAYVSQFPKIENFTVIENKGHLLRYPGPSKRFTPDQPLRFLLTGTIASVYGVWEAIRWFEKILPLQENHVLEIKGHVPMKSLMDTLNKRYGKNDNIELWLSAKPVETLQIESWIKESDILLLPYHLLPSTHDKVPTKLYESMALQTPVIVQKNPIWEQVLAPYPGGMGIDFFDLNDPITDFKKFLTMEFFTKKPGGEVDWQIEKLKFQEVIDNIISNQKSS